MARQFKSKNGFKSRSFKMVSDRIADSRSNAYQASRSKRFKARKAVSKPSFVRQLKALVASKKKDAADVIRTTNAMAATSIACLTSTTNYAVAPSGTGLIDMDGDECLINSVRIKGILENACIIKLDPTGHLDARIRKLVVWFNKPLLVASAAGTLPPITEVLLTDDINSLPVTAAANGGRFVILSNKYWNLGTNTVASNAGLAARIRGQSATHVDYTVKVNKMCKFKIPTVSGTPAGHYDSDIGPGQVDKGLLVCYTQIGGTAGGFTINDNVTTRLNYTG